MIPIIWFSKKQNTIETSTYGPEFLALKTAQEMIDGLIFKLQMLGVPISGPTRVFCDNKFFGKEYHLPRICSEKETLCNSIPQGERSSCNEKMSYIL